MSGFPCSSSSTAVLLVPLATDMVGLTGLLHGGTRPGYDSKPVELM